jgi:hypothetical protein
MSFTTAYASYDVAIVDTQATPLRTTWVRDLADLADAVALAASWRGVPGFWACTYPREPKPT